MFIYLCTEYSFYLQYMFAYLASLYKLLRHNTIEYIQLKSLEQLKFVFIVHF